MSIHSHPSKRMRYSLPFSIDQNLNDIEAFLKNLKTSSYPCFRMLSELTEEIKLHETQKVGSLSSALMKHKSKISQLLTFSWEKIHSDKWNKPELTIWRDLYAISSIWECARLFLNEFNSKNYQSLKPIIRQLDLGIMIGAARFQSAMQDFVNIVHELYVEDGHENEEANVDNDEKKNAKMALVDMKNKDNNPFLGQALICSELPCVDKEMLSLNEFVTDYFKKQKPLVIRNYIDDWPALSRWNDIDYLLHTAGHRTVPVEIGRIYTDDNWTQSLMTLQEFLQHFVLKTSANDKHDSKSDETNTSKNASGYLAQHQLFDQIQCWKTNHDFYVPDFVHVGDRDFDEYGTINAWLGPKGTITPIHFDDRHNILTQVVGYKYLMIFDPSESEHLYSFQRNSHLLFNTSQIGDFDITYNIQSQSVDITDLKHLVQKFPLFQHAKYKECILGPGDHSTYHLFIGILSNL
ncbi:hypothetical protein RFI_13089 [Reticulomyxa filosa]|uniref:Uncharacterized protein n=1 Tax=Reticulomyxa filosa TaxID=46433 RepID=X6NEA0_RETFI|nr:hypothetical protein RFI_13089 [Reticulomyxa filosa]|eukprot:ETO24074.1 hypothetical protein RFI_13089 [Reticulomyxa filosa]